MISKVGKKLVKRTFYLEQDDIEIFEKYGLKEGKSTASLIRSVMSKYAITFQKSID